MKWHPPLRTAPPEQSAYDADFSLEYRISMALVKGTNIPAQILVQKMDWNTEQRTARQGTDAEETASAADTPNSLLPENMIYFPNDIWDHSTIVWTWTNPDIQITEEPRNHFYELDAYPAPGFPYISYGYKNWLAWQENEFLQDLQPDKEPFYTMPRYNVSASGTQSFQPQTKRMSEVYITADNEFIGSYFLVIAVDCHP